MKLLTNYIIALTQFYGLVTPEIVVAMYNQQNEHQIIEEDVYTILYNPPEKLREHDIFPKGHLFVHKSLFMGEDTLVRLIEDKSDKPYYLPSKSELRNYLDPNYIEKNDQFYHLYNYLKEHLEGFTEEFIEEICEHFVLVLRDDDLNFGYVVRYLKKCGISLETNMDFETLVSLVTELGSNVRMWPNNGYTRKELLQTRIAILLHEEAYELNVLSDVIYHCGSGDYYKECCMTRNEKVKCLNDYRQ